MLLVREEVSHTCPSAMTGDDQPSPGTGTFQAIFFDSLHSSGSSVSDEYPWPLGPLNCGQSLAVVTTAVSSKPSTVQRVIHLMGLIVVRLETYVAIISCSMSIKHFTYVVVCFLLFLTVPLPLFGQTVARTTLYVDETQGIRRFFYPVDARVPFASGELGDSENVRLLSDGTEIPATYTALEAWPDGSVRWLGVNFNVSIGPLGAASFEVEYGPSVRNVVTAPRGLIVRFKSVVSASAKEEIRYFSRLTLEVKQSGRDETAFGFTTMTEKYFPSTSRP